MKKKLLGILFALVLCALVFPAAGMAATEITNTTTTPWSGDCEIKGDVTINQKVTLSGDVNLNLNGHTLMITSSSGSGIYGNGHSLNITGGGKLEVSTTDNSGGDGIFCGNLTVNSGTITATSGTDPDTDTGTGTGIRCSGTFTMKDGTVTATSTTGSAIECGTFTMNGGTIKKAYANNRNYHGINCQNFEMNDGTIEEAITGGTGDGINCQNFEMNGGTIKKATGNSGIRCNKTFTMKNGTVTVAGKNGIVCESAFNMQGGTLTATAERGSTDESASGIACTSFEMSGGTLKATGNNTKTAPGFGIECGGNFTVTAFESIDLNGSTTALILNQGKTTAIPSGYTIAIPSGYIGKGSTIYSGDLNDQIDDDLKRWQWDNGEGTYYNFDSPAIKGVLAKHLTLAAKTVAQTLSFAESKIVKKVGDAAFTQAVSGAKTTVAYSSSDESVATVDAAGKVTILKAGTTTITATAAATEDYLEGKASYTLTVIPITVESNPKGDTPATGLKDAAAVKKAVGAVLTKEEAAEIEKGGSVAIRLDAEKKTAPSGDDAAKAMTQTALGSNGRKIGYYLDLSLYVKVGSLGERKVTDLNEAITITTEIPADIAAINGNFGIVRYHNNQAEVMPSEYDAATRTLTFTTDGFSDYAVIMTPNSPATGITESHSGNLSAAVILAAFAVVLAAVMVVRWSKSR